MNRFQRRGLVFIAIAIIIALLVWWRGFANKAPDARKNVGQTSNGLDHRGRNNAGNKLEKMRDLLARDYGMSIDFWGKVTEQDGTPLAGVKAEIAVDGLSKNVTHVVYSDKDGLFELLGKSGARLRVKVSLDGYAPSNDKKFGTDISARTIYYTPDSKPMPFYAPPTRKNPQVFVLRKKNPITNLTHSIRENVPVKRDGTAEKIELQAGERTVAFEVRCWSSCPIPFDFEKYDWKAEIKVIGGKIQPITENDPVKAPISSYQPSIGIEMPKDTTKIWLRGSPMGLDEFWLRFDDGTYAKARIQVETGRKHEVDAEVWCNPDGSTNFEQ